eukprot:746596-Hanusia_phi.AAC.2
MAGERKRRREEGEGDGEGEREGETGSGVRGDTRQDAQQKDKKLRRAPSSGIQDGAEGFCNRGAGSVGGRIAAARSFFKKHEGSLQALRPPVASSRPAVGWAAARMKIAEEAAAWLMEWDVCQSLAREPRFASLLVKVLKSMRDEEKLCEALRCVMDEMLQLSRHPSGVEVVLSCIQLMASKARLASSSQYDPSLLQPVVNRMQQVVAGEEWQSLLSERRTVRVACAMLELARDLHDSRGEAEQGATSKNEGKASRKNIDGAKESRRSLMDMICARTLQYLEDVLSQNATDDAGFQFLQFLLSVLRSGKHDGWKDKYVERLLAIKADTDGEEISEDSYRNFDILLQTASGQGLVKELLMICCTSSRHARMLKNLLRFCLRQIEAVDACENVKPSNDHQDSASSNASSRQKEEECACSSAMKVSFFLLCEGQSKASCFKPDKDDSQWCCPPAPSFSCECLEGGDDGTRCVALSLRHYGGRKE